MRAWTNLGQRHKYHQLRRQHWSHSPIDQFETRLLLSATAQYLMRGLEMHGAAAADMDASLEGLLEGAARFNWPACLPACLPACFSEWIQCTLMPLHGSASIEWPLEAASVTSRECQSTACFLKFPESGRERRTHVERATSTSSPLYAYTHTTYLLINECYKHVDKPSWCEW